MDAILQKNNSILLKSISFNDYLVIKPNILIFDSGVGGLSIYDKIRKTLPNANYLYVFDNEGFPYGKKSEQFILNRVLAIISKIWHYHKINLIIIACNTASIVSLTALRKHFSCPIVGVVPAIKSAAQLTRNGVVGLLATYTTIKHNYISNLISQYANSIQILKLEINELVYMAEAKLHGESIELPILKKILYPVLKTTIIPDTIILGCTHLLLLNQELQEVLPQSTSLIDSGSAINRRILWLMKNEIHFRNLQNKYEPNKVYCLATTPQSISLIPVLMQYGFNLFESITI